MVLVAGRLISPTRFTALTAIAFTSGESSETDRTVPGRISVFQRLFWQVCTTQRLGATPEPVLQLMRLLFTLLTVTTGVSGAGAFSQGIAGTNAGSAYELRSSPELKPVFCIMLFMFQCT